jgi:hypothetical protein
MFAGVSDGGVDIKDPKDEKQNDASNIPGIKKYMNFMEIPIINPTTIGIIVTITPNIKEARISPSIIVDINTGEEISLSSVFVLVSHGAISGTTAAAVKKSAIEIKPGSRSLVDRFLPTPNAKKRKIGNKIPKINTGALKKYIRISFLQIAHAFFSCLIHKIIFHLLL